MKSVSLESELQFKMEIPTVTKVFLARGEPRSFDNLRVTLTLCDFRLALNDRMHPIALPLANPSRLSLVVQYTLDFPQLPFQAIDSAA